MNVFLLMLHLSAQPVAAEVVQLSPDDAVALALAENVEHKALLIRASEEQVRASKWIQLENPELRLGDFRSDRLINPLIDGSGWDNPLEDTRFGLRWKPPPLRWLGAEQKARNFRSKRFQADVLDGEQLLEKRVRILHAELQNLKRRVALADDAVKLASRVRNMIQRRIKANAATRLDEALSNLDYLDEVADRERLESRYRSQLSSLREMLALPLSTNISLVSPRQSMCGPVIVEDHMLQDVSDVHPRVSALDASIREVDANLFSTYLAFSPWFDFFQLAYVPGGRNDPASLRFRLSVALPLFDQERDKAAMLRARRHRLVAVRNATQHGIRSKLHQSLEELHSQVEMMRIYEENAANVLATSEAILELALAGKNGDLLEVALVKNRVLRARRGEMRVFLACEKAAIEVQVLSGEVTKAALPPPWNRKPTGEDAGAK
ncbi:MAG: TolC family protein [Deltaproteobacteria bacterium]|nr:TolC family protein [Deltaproteobacteria bacterium]